MYTANFYYHKSIFHDVAILSQVLYDSKVAKFGANASEERFLDVFIEALHSVKADMEIECNIDFEPPEELDTNISLDDKYWTVLSLGLDYHISSCGEWTLEDTTTVERRYNRAKKLAQMEDHKDNETEGKLGDQS